MAVGGGFLLQAIKPVRFVVQYEFFELLTSAASPINAVGVQRRQFKVKMAVLASCKATSVGTLVMYLLFWGGRKGGGEGDAS